MAQTPALELDGPSIKLGQPGVITAQPGQADQYRLPPSYQSDDLCRPGDPPSALGGFWPKPKA